MAVLGIASGLATGSALAAGFELRIINGRVIDPASGLDAVRHLGISGGRVQVVGESPPEADATIDAAGLAVIPGFVDLHQHAWDDASLAFKVRDGVTSVFELEVGTADIDRWYADRAGRTPVHFGASIGHIPVRMKVMGDFPAFLPAAGSGAATREATDDHLRELAALVEDGLARGAPAVGFGLQYTPAASRWEVFAMFEVAARHNAPCHVHLRSSGHRDPGGVQALAEVIAAAAVTGAPLHVVHINSTGGKLTSTLLDMIAGARERGIDVTVECYPYTAGMTDLSSAIFDEGFREELDIDYGDLQWGATGERLTGETFARYRQEGGLVIVHQNTEERVAQAVAHPLTMIASDGLDGHPRNCGTFARILGKYARDDGALDLATAVRKTSFLPAERLSARVPAMARKGRIQPGADADLVVFNPDSIADQATFTEPRQASTGIEHVLVLGTPVVSHGKLVEGIFPGQGLRAPAKDPAE